MAILLADDNQATHQQISYYHALCTGSALMLELPSEVILAFRVAHPLGQGP